MILKTEKKKKKESTKPKLSFEQINKPLARFTKKKKKRPDKIKIERRDTEETEKIIREYYGLLYVNKLDNQSKVKEINF